MTRRQQLRELVVTELPLELQILIFWYAIPTCTQRQINGCGRGDKAPSHTHPAEIPHVLDYAYLPRSISTILYHQEIQGSFLQFIKLKTGEYGYFQGLERQMGVLTLYANVESLAHQLSLDFWDGTDSVLLLNQTDPMEGVVDLFRD